MSDFTQLAGGRSYGEPGQTESLEGGLLAFLQWGLLGLNAFATVRIPTSGYAGGFHSTLRPTNDLRYSGGQVWQAARKDWIYESGVPVNNPPLSISGVWVNGTLIPNASTGPYSFKIDYPNGRVIFNAPIPTSTVVTCEYSYRRVQLYRANNEWFQQLQFNSADPSDSHLQTYASGVWNIFSQNRVQLPALVIQQIPNIVQAPRELGSLARVQQQELVIHVLAEQSWEQARLHDILMDQYQKTFYTVNAGLMATLGKTPLNPDGTLASGVTDYPNLVDPHLPDNCCGKPVIIERLTSQSYLAAPKFYWSEVRATLKWNLP